MSILAIIGAVTGLVTALGGTGWFMHRRKKQRAAAAPPPIGKPPAK